MTPVPVTVIAPPWIGQETGPVMIWFTPMTPSLAIQLKPTFSQVGVTAQAKPS
jgi:hypothetical protein